MTDAPGPEVVLVTGEKVFVTYRGRRVAGRVKLASQNGYSLMIEFDAMLGGYVGMMPVLWVPSDRHYRCMVEGETVSVERAAPRTGVA